MLRPTASNGRSKGERLGLRGLQVGESDIIHRQDLPCEKGGYDPPGGALERAFTYRDPLVDYAGTEEPIWDLSIEVRVLKWHGVDEGESELPADFISLVSPRNHLG